MKLNLKDAALLIVDLQNDFLPGGSLAVNEGDQLVPLINLMQEKFQTVVATQDYHPSDHKSFASNHFGKKPGDLIQLNGLNQILWPIHCVQGLNGSEFHKDLNRQKWTAIFQKGLNPEVDSYSGFYDNARREDTGLGNFLKEKEIKKVFVAGLALDYCVKFTAMDAVSLGFETFLISDATKAVNLNPNDGDRALEEMSHQGIKIISSKELI
jgi:nicotinamidase/pyrazinamidase